MSTYAPAVIWLLSSLVCLAIARRRHVRPTTAKAMLVTLIGPFAIPVALFAAPEKSRQG